MARNKTAGPEPSASELFEAILAGDSARLQALLDRGGDANAEHRCEPSLFEELGLGFHTDAIAPLLVVAAGFGHADMVAALLNHGADIRNFATYWGYVVVSANEQIEYTAGNALHAATANGHQKIIELLKAQGA